MRDRECCVRIAPALALGTKPVSRRTSLTLVRVFADTCGCPLSMRDTVLCETPLSLAISGLVRIAFEFFPRTFMVVVEIPIQTS